MVTIETVATITEEGTMTAKVPGHLPQGEHRVVIVVDEAPVAQRTGKFPDMSEFRKSLGAPAPGNTVLKMREDERS